jgi:uncharacterized membrane-anchored protein
VSGLPPSDVSALPLVDHPLRRALTEELHLRRFPVFTAPARLLQIVMLSGEGNFAADRSAAEQLCARFGISPSPGKHFACALGSLQFIWERHTEFTSYSFLKPDPVDLLFKDNLIAHLPPDWLPTVPGKVLRATQIAVLDRLAPEPSDEDITGVFARPDLVSCTVASGGARIWSDFRVHPDGLGRLLIHNRSLLPSDLTRVVQQLQELGNYRNMVLLGLPDAQRLAPDLSELQTRLGNLTDEIASTQGDDDRLLGDLSTLSAELARLTAQTSYRMSATQAYAELASDRLRSLGSERVAGYPTLSDFVERRLVPAVRTCLSFTRRLDDLSNRTAWASSLLRTRVETTLEHQSRDLLESMNHRTDLQLRLQQTVEGLSVVAITYYAIGLVSYLAKALEAFAPRVDALLLTAAAVPIVLLAVGFVLKRTKRRLQPPPIAARR